MIRILAAEIRNESALNLGRILGVQRDDVLGTRASEVDVCYLGGT